MLRLKIIKGNHESVFNEWSEQNPAFNIISTTAVPCGASVWLFVYYVEGETQKIQQGQVIVPPTIVRP
jgi:hypothetical protein